MLQVDAQRGQVEPEARDHGGAVEVEASDIGFELLVDHHRHRLQGVGLRAFVDMALVAGDRLAGCVEPHRAAPEFDGLMVRPFAQRRQATLDRLFETVRLDIHGGLDAILAVQEVTAIIDHIPNQLSQVADHPSRE